MNNIEFVKNLLTQNLTNAKVEVSDMTGTDDHLEILVATDDFNGKMLFEQHQMVMDILRESLKEKIHAVKIKTMTLKKFNEAQG